MFANLVRMNELTRSRLNRTQVWVADRQGQGKHCKQPGIVRTSTTIHLRRRVCLGTIYKEVSAKAGGANQDITAPSPEPESHTIEQFHARSSLFRFGQEMSLRPEFEWLFEDSRVMQDTPKVSPFNQHSQRYRKESCTIYCR